MYLKAAFAISFDKKTSNHEMYSNTNVIIIYNKYITDSSYYNTCKYNRNIN